MIHDFFFFQAISIFNFFYFMTFFTIFDFFAIFTILFWSWFFTNFSIFFFFFMFYNNPKSQSIEYFRITEFSRIFHVSCRYWEYIINLLLFRLYRLIWVDHKLNMMGGSFIFYVFWTIDLIGESNLHYKTLLTVVKAFSKIRKDSPFLRLSNLLGSV